MYFDRSMIRPAAFVAATAIGAGIFALPYVANEAGWLTALVYLVGLAAAVHFAHRLYLRTLQAGGEKKRLLGLTALYFGRWGRLAAVTIILGGLLLTLVAYLILAQRFIAILTPAYASGGAILFWLAASFPIFVQLRRLVIAELIGTLALAAIIIGIFVLGVGQLETLPPLFDAGQAFLPFGAILFALAAWPAVEPVFEYQRARGLSLKETSFAMAAGLGFAAVLYLLFTVGIFGATAFITPDTLTGLWGFPPAGLAALIILGLFAFWTSYVPIGLEIRNSLEHDLDWSPAASDLTVFFLPPLLILAGLNNFFAVISLVGGVFLAGEYLFILLVARRALPLARGERFGVWLVTAVFTLAAAYEIYYFLIS